MTGRTSITSLADLVRNELRRRAPPEPWTSQILDNPRLAFTQVPDWVMTHESVTPTAFRLWCILRSMKFETGQEIPPLTLDQVCWLLPGIKGKPTSRTRAREALDVLLGEGLLKDASERGLGRAAARSYVTKDRPERAMGWTSARQKLSKYRKEWRG